MVPHLTVPFQITNSRKTEMPGDMRLHPYFVRTLLAIITVKMEKIWVSGSGNIWYRLQSVQESECLSLDLNVNKKTVDHIFSSWNREVLISWLECKASLKISVEVLLDFLVIFTLQDEDYFYVETIIHVNNAFNSMDRGD